MNTLSKTFLSITATGLLTVGLVGCAPAMEETPEPAPPAPTEEMSETTEPLASIASLTGVDTQVNLDVDFLAALESLGVAPGVVGSASLDGTVLAFPITGGNLDYYDPDSTITPFIQGDIAHDGSGLSLTAGDTVVELTNFLIDTDTLTLTGTVSVNGEVAAEGAELFTLDPAMLERLAVNEDGTATLAGAELLLSQTAADLLNSTFSIDALAGGLLIGSTVVTVNV